MTRPLRSIVFLPAFLLSIFLSFSLSTQAQLVRVKKFGTDPGRLKMYLHTPPGSDAKARMPLVVVLHGCLQNAKIVANQSGWNKLADEYGFRVLYPQQRVINNPMQCFCIYRRDDIEKGKGENYSIKEMIEEVERENNTDSARVFVTGLSAGALMAVSVMADYPETFAAGAVFAGAPYKSVTNIWTGLLTSYGWRAKRPADWAALVRGQNPDYHGAYPRMIIYQGKMDVVVNKNNGKQLVKQWTVLHGISQTPDETIRHFARSGPVERNIYNDSSGYPAVIYYRLRGVGHALPVDPGRCAQQGGRLTAFSRDINYNSAYWTAVDFGLIERPVIKARSYVASGEGNVPLSVPGDPSARYIWHLPKGCRIIGDKNSNSIRVNWGSTPGNIDVKEIKGKCKKVYSTRYMRIWNNPERG
jgi:poly(hydroxyalkanoate) depolymerase family esterase